MSCYARELYQPRPAVGRKYPAASAGSKKNSGNPLIGVLLHPSIGPAFPVTSGVFRLHDWWLELLMVCRRDLRVGQSRAPCKGKVLHVIEHEYRSLRSDAGLDVREVGSSDVRQKKAGTGVGGRNHLVAGDLDIFRMANKKAVRRRISEHVWFRILFFFFL